MHRLNTLRVLKHLQGLLGLDQAMRDPWCRHWMEEGFAALERRLASEPEAGRLCHGDRPPLADVCRVSQAVSSKRWGTDLGPCPTVRRSHDACLEIEAFVRAMPASQPDAE